MDEEFIDVTEMLEHDVELSNDGVAIAGGKVLFALADDVVKRVVVPFEQDLSTDRNNNALLC